MDTAARIRAIGLAVEYYRPRFDVLGVDADRVLLYTLWRLDAKQDPKGKFGNKRPGIPCGKGYISWRKKCGEGKGAIAQERLKGTAEGKDYANRVRKFKGLEKVREKKNLEPETFTGFGAKNKLTEEWSVAWNEKTIDRDLKKAIQKAHAPADLRGKGSEIIPEASAYYQWGQDGINMQSHKPGSGRSSAVYRHEYGHFLDAAITKKLGVIGKKPLTSEEHTRDEQENGSMFVSSSSDGKLALKKDNARLLKQKKEADAKKLKTAAWYTGISPEKIKETYSDQMEDWAIEAASRELEPYALASAEQLVKTGDKAFTNKGAKAAWELVKEAHPQDDRRGNFKKAFDRIAAYQKYKDPSMLINAYERDVNSQKFDGSSTRGLMDDLVGSITKNQIGIGHSNQYYEKNEGAQGMEAFANIVAMMGTDKHSAAIASELAPGMYKFTKDRIRRFNDAK